MRPLLLMLCSFLLAAGVSARQSALTVQQILQPAPSSWPTYNGDYSGKRFSSLTRITDRNVRHLSLAWLYDLPSNGGGVVKGTPLLVDGILYFTNPDHAYAVEARTGRQVWHYTWARNRGGIHIGNRGAAILGDAATTHHRR